MNVFPLICPQCGAHLNLFLNNQMVKCDYCDYSALLETSESMGYNFEKGRIRAQQDNEDGLFDNWSFPTFMSFSEFSRICYSVAKKYSKIKNITVVGKTVKVLVEEKTSWKFSIHFVLDDNKNIDFSLYPEDEQSPLAFSFSNHICQEIKEYEKRITKDWLYYDCPNCGNNMIQKNRSSLFECTKCSCTLPPDALDDGSNFWFWFCDKCGSYLNMQDHFSAGERKWKCLRCGFENNVDPNDPKTIIH